MKDKDKILDDYRKKVDELLDDQGSLNLSKPLDQEEMDDIWDEISVELDLDEVWNNISSDLDVVMPEGSGSGIIVKYFAAVLIILFGIVFIRQAILVSDIHKPGVLTETKQNRQSPDQIVTIRTGDLNTGEQVKKELSPALRRSADKNENGNKTIPADRNTVGLIQGMPIPVNNQIVSEIVIAAEMADSNPVVSLHETPTEKSGVSPALIPVIPKRIDVLPKIDFDNLIINENPPASGFTLPSTDGGRFSAGLTVLFRNSWLLNSETRDGLKSETLNSTEIVFFPDAGLSLNYSINKTWLLQADGFFYSSAGQAYHDYIYGHYSSKKITLRYSTLALSVKYKFTCSSRLIPRSSVNVFTGGYFSVLHQVRQEINTDIVYIGSQYEKFDFGVRLGSEIELSLSDQLSLAPGLFMSIGIPNIFKGDCIFPGYLKETHNASVGFNLAFYYHFD